MSLTGLCPAGFKQTAHIFPTISFCTLFYTLLRAKKQEKIWKCEVKNNNPITGIFGKGGLLHEEIFKHVRKLAFFVHPQESKLRSGQLIRSKTYFKCS
jgi:hypothetical protein